MTSMRMFAHFLPAIVALAGLARPRNALPVGFSELTVARRLDGWRGGFGWRGIARNCLAVAALAGLALAARAGSLQFDGTADYAYIYINVSETAATHELWFKTTSPNGGLLSVTDGGNGHDRHIYLKDGDIYTRLWTDEAIHTTGLGLADGQWHHVAHVFGGAEGGQKIYVDGVLRASGAKVASDFNWQDRVLIGFSADATAKYFNGKVAEVRLWNVARSAAQIASTMATRLQGDEAGLQGYYRFEEGTGFSSVDLAGYNETIWFAGGNSNPSWVNESPFADLGGAVVGTNGAPLQGATVKLERYGDLTTVYAISRVMPAVHSEAVASINYGNAAFYAGQPQERWGAIFEGPLVLPFPGNFTFYLGSDDGAILFIDGKPIVNRDYLTAYSVSQGNVALGAGTHWLEVRFFQNYGARALTLEWSGVFRVTAQQFVFGTPSGTVAVDVGLGRQVLSQHRIQGSGKLDPIGFVTYAYDFKAGLDKLSAYFYDLSVPVATVTTDASGSYTFANLLNTPVRYRVVASYPDYTMTPAERVNLLPPASAQNFTVTVSPPSITDQNGNPGIPNITVPEGNSQAVSFNVNDLQTEAAALVVTYTSDNQSLLPDHNIAVNGTGVARTLTVTPLPHQNGVAHVQVTVSDATGQSATTTVTVTVNAVNDAPIAGSGTALAFDGNRSFVNLGAVAVTGDQTLELWINPANLNARQNPLSKAFGGEGTITLEPDGTLTYSYGTAGGDSDPYQSFSSVVPLAVNTWTHVALVRDLSTDHKLRWYLNSLLVNEADAQYDHATASSQPMTLGSGYAGDFTGSIDEVRVWNIARSESELYQNLTTPLKGDEAGLVAYWRLDEGSGVYLSDSSGHARVGTLYRGPYIANGPTWSAGPPDFPTWQVIEDQAKDVFLNGFDFEGAPLTYTIVTPPANGTVSPISGGTFKYTPGLHFHGDDAITYTVNDGQFDSAPFTVKLKVQEINYPPTISGIPNQLIVEDTDTGPVPFVVGDVETDPAAMQLRYRIINAAAVPLKSVEFGGSGANRTITITPQPGEVGTITVVVTVDDTSGTPTATASTQFDLAVVPRPAYAVVDVGTLPDWSTSHGQGINDQGLVAGYAGRNGSSATRAFLYNGIADGGTLTDLGTLGGNNSAAFGINNTNQVVGTSQNSSGQNRAFLYGNVFKGLEVVTNAVFNPSTATFDQVVTTNQLFGLAMTSLGTLPGGTTSEARGINNSGLVAGWADFTGKSRAFLYGGALTNIGLLAGGQFSQAVALNDAGQLVGWGDLASGETHAFVYEPDGSVTEIPRLAGQTNNFAYGINDAGAVVGYSEGPAQSQAFVYSGGASTALGYLPGGAVSRALGINTFGQVVGQAGDAQGNLRAFVYTAGTMYNLNDLLPEGSGWVLNDARGINHDGLIVGTGTFHGNDRAYVAVPAFVIGKRVPRPFGAVARKPEINILTGDPSDTGDNAFFWSPLEQKLYAIRPVTARLSWYTSDDPADTNRLVAIGINVWPKTPTIHVAQAPVEVEPPGVSGFSYNFQQIYYTTSPGAVVDPSSKQFFATAKGYSVLYYLRNNGEIPADPTKHLPYFEVVRTVLWDQVPYLKDGQPWTIGNTLVYSNHFDYLGKNGFMMFTNSFYDGAGLDKAYDRNTRRGPIIPVNQKNDLVKSDFVVVWYQTNKIGVAWAGQPVRYNLSWPADTTNKIIIASTLGTGPLDPALYPQLKIYNQPDPSLPGFNPNEEHALIVPSSSGQAAYALRNDLNPLLNLSEPYVLVKYKNPGTGAWTLKVYKVLTEEAPYFFRYRGEAGKEIQPPMPLSVLTLCDASKGISGPFWEDYKGKLYAKSAGPEGTSTNLTIRWQYPVQPGFFYDLNLDGTADVAEGQCIPWLDYRAGGIVGESVNVNYDIRWPDDVPVLQFGDTLLKSKNELPGVKNMANAGIIFDDLNPLGATPLSGLARLFDPLSGRTIALPKSFEFPTSIKRVNINGKEYFADLPYALKVRLTYDPINKWLTFSGYLDEAFGVGPNPLLLVNVLSERERDRIKVLAPDSTAWSDAIDLLYYLTLNPNQVDVDRVNGPDRELRLGLITQYTVVRSQKVTNSFNGVVSTQYLTNYTFALPSNLTDLTIVSTNVVPEPLGDLTKALTAAQGGVPPATPRPGNALAFAGAGYVGMTTLGALQDFTIGVWAKIGSANTGPLFGALKSADVGIFLRPEPAANRFVLADRPDTSTPLGIVSHAFDAGWHFYSLVRSLKDSELRVFVDGVLVGTVPAAGLTSAVGMRLGDGFTGQLDEFQIWNIARSGEQIAAKMNKRLNGHEDGLLACWQLDEGAGGTVADATGLGFGGTIVGGPAWITSTAPAGIPPRYLTIAENNDPDLPGLPVALHIIQVDDGPYRGDIKVLPSDNVFDERLTLRHSGDFGGAPGRVNFEWYYKPDSADFNPEDLPVVDPVTGDLSDPRGWIKYPTDPADGKGVNDITIGEGGESGLLTLSDNWFICRYRGYEINLKPATAWSDWVGDPAGVSQPRAALAEGWIKRVLRGLNPFDSRISDFHEAEASTYTSMLVQAGKRYEGPIPFNPSADAINSVGLIEAYETVLRRGKGLSIDGVPSVNFDPANNALLLVSGKIADLYMLLGNEAYADASDPTIGFGTSSSEYGSLATSVFAFMNQLDSLLEEELVLLRGRDDHSAGVQAPPVYNRLYWNFTLGEGEVAYQQTYNVSDQNRDGFLDEKDAAILYPQGHGDAWGHYLTAIMEYYSLLRHPNFTWIPRAESVSVAGTAVQVDFLDERKFARAAAAKARTGKEVVDLTYRLNYVEDPAGQWQGYQDTDTDRAWGVTEWARRAGQGAYFDWLTANTILPAEDPNPNHAGIQKIDRTTVGELTEIQAQHDEIQTLMDQADIGLNPVGLEKGTVPFDIDPTFLTTASTIQSKTHFEQVYDRAIKAMGNAVTVWNEANKATQMLRGNQDSVDAFTRNLRDREYDFKNRLIEVFGYPYAGDIGAGKTYPSGYDGPDLYHYMYVNTKEVTGVNAPPSTNFVGYFTAPQAGLATNDFFLGFNPTTLETSVLQVNYPISAADYGFVAPEAWGQRRAPGEIQMALSDLVQAEALLKKAMQDYDGLIQDIQAAIDLLKTLYDVDAQKITLLSNNETTLSDMNSEKLRYKRAQVSLNRINDTVTEQTDNLLDGVPKFAVAGLAFGGDLAAPLRGAVRFALHAVKLGMSIASDVMEVQQVVTEQDKEDTQLQTDIQLAIQDQRLDVQQRVKDLEHQVRNEAATRLAVFNQREVVQQAGGRYLAAVAKGQRIIEERVRFRQSAAGQIQNNRYRDMTFRIFRNDALQKYRAQFDLALRYVYLAATAYDYEVNLLRTDTRAGAQFLTDLIRQRSLGQMNGEQPVVGEPGLADPLGRLSQNFGVLKTQLGINNPQTETGRFSLRNELFRIGQSTASATNVLGVAREENWKRVLTKSRVANLWDVPEFRRYMRPFAPENLGPQPGIVIRFPTTVTFGLNFFGWPLAGGDSAYDSSRFATKVRSVGVWFTDYDGNDLSLTPRVYLVPLGMDVLRSPSGDNLETREWRIVDQQIPIPFPIGSTTLHNPSYIPINDALGGTFAEIRRYAGIRAYHDSGEFDPAEATTDSRLIGRSVWNSQWMLVIPGGTLLNDPDAGLDKFINSVSDIKIFFQTYSYPGN